MQFVSEGIRFEPVILCCEQLQRKDAENSAILQDIIIFDDRCRKAEGQYFRHFIPKTLIYSCHARVP